MRLKLKLKRCKHIKVVFSSHFQMVQLFFIALSVLQMSQKLKETLLRLLLLRKQRALLFQSKTGLENLKDSVPNGKSKVKKIQLYSLELPRLSMLVVHQPRNTSLTSLASRLVATNSRLPSKLKRPENTPSSTLMLQLKNQTKFKPLS